MERLTFEGNFCDIAQCKEIPCPYNGECSQRKVWERLKAYEDTHMMPSDVTSMRMDMAIIAALFNGVDVDRMKELAEADKDGRLVVLPSNKALTNADRMRTSTNQQLAKQIYDTQKELCRMLYKKLGFEDELNFSEDYSDILAWLNAPSKEAEKALEAMKDG